MSTPPRRLLGRLSRATIPIIPGPDEDTQDPRPDLTAAAYKNMLDNAENRLIRAQGSLENVMRHLGERRRWAGKTQAQVLAEITDELLEVHLIVTGGTK